MIYFTSDTHFGHKGSLNWPNGKARNFKDVAEMNQIIIDNWNAVIKDTDVVYHLGDFAYKTSVNTIKHIFESLNGIIIFIEGNHDKQTLKADKQVHRFKSIHTQLNLKDDLVIKDKTNSICSTTIFVLDHYPRTDWFMKEQGAIHLHGHVHGTLQELNNNIKRYDCSVEVNNYTPISIDEIINKFKTK